MAYIELDKAHYFHNLNYLCKKLGTKERLAVVLKDNAYGHGLSEMAVMAREFGIGRVIVRNRREAEQIAGMFPFILILSPERDTIAGDFSWVINSLEMLARMPKESKIHLKIDSGMHRNGIMIEEIEQAFIMIQEHGLLLEGVMTHMRSGDELSCEFFWQMKVWEEIKVKISVLIAEYGWEKPLFHSANSASLLRLSVYHDDFARCGIATYGYEEFHKSFGAFDLKPVMCLWGEKIATRLLKKGEKVGYGGIGEISCDRVVSTYDVGYGDGIFRYDGKGDFQTADGRQIIGRVSMDNMSVEGDADKVLIFGDAKALAHYHRTISFDVVTKLSPYLKRVVKA